MDSFRILNKDEALEFLEFARKYHNGDIQLPPEIIRMRKLIDEKIENAELFLVLVRAVDMGMIRDIMRLKLELEHLYSEWIQGNLDKRKIH